MPLTKTENNANEKVVAPICIPLHWQVQTGMFWNWKREVRNKTALVTKAKTYRKPKLKLVS